MIRKDTKKLIGRTFLLITILSFLISRSKSLTATSNPMVIKVVIRKLDRLNVPVSTRLIARLSKIHRHKSCNVDTVKTIFENLVFIIPISKKIFEITGIEVIATAITNTKIYAVRFPAVPMKAS